MEKNDKLISQCYVNGDTGEVEFEINLNGLIDVSDSKKLVLLNTLKVLGGKITEMVNGDVPDLESKTRVLVISMGESNFETVLNESIIKHLSSSEMRALMRTFEHVATCLPRIFIGGMLGKGNIDEVKERLREKFDELMKSKEGKDLMKKNFPGKDIIN